MKLVVFLLAALAATPALAQRAIPTGLEHQPRAEAYARKFASRFITDAMLQSAVRESTKQHSRLDWGEQRALDRKWRDELADNTKGGLTDAIINNRLSEWLKEHLADAPNGAVTEILIIDGLGWNVGQTMPTSDFFQGDEMQWQNVLPGGSNAMVVSELEDNGKGERTLALVSLPIVDTDRGNNIGVVTLGIDTSKIP